MLNNIFIQLALILLVNLNYGCNKEKNVNGIALHTSLIISYSEKGIDYERLLEESLNKNDESIKKFSVLYFNGEASYEHCEVLVQVIDRIGEESYMQLIDGLSHEEKQHLILSIRVGLEPLDVDFEKKYPKLYIMLKNNERI